MSRYLNRAVIIALLCGVAMGGFGPGTNQNASGVSYGTNEVAAIYCGTNLVWSLSSGPAYVSAAGGTVVTYAENGTNFTAHIFTESGTLSVTSGGIVDVLVVGGGGGGGRASPGNSGGGGGGGLVYTNNYRLETGPHAVAVGAGGLASVASNGGNSAFDSLEAVGGGHGGAYYFGFENEPIQYIEAQDGGSGGGGSQFTGTEHDAPGIGVMGQGHDGGSYSGSGYAGGGGGGAGAVGSDGYSNDPYDPYGNGENGGNGGNGIEVSISGTPTFYAGGGGGSTHSSGLYGSSGGLGGGGGGHYTIAGDPAINVPGVSGSNGLGGGGGGGGEFTDGGDGGSGIVIVRYVTAQ